MRDGHFCVQRFHDKTKNIKLHKLTVITFTLLVDQDYCRLIDDRLHNFFKLRYDKV